MQFEMQLFDEPAVEIEPERWRVVAEFPRYEVSSYGRFRRRRNGKILGGTLNYSGYQHINLVRDGKNITKLAHRLVAETFLEVPSESHVVVNHKNKIRNDNRVVNLEWATLSWNAKHGKLRF